jgi:hypothetical protein
MGIWMPQIVDAERESWPDGYGKAGVALIGIFLVVGSWLGRCRRVTL